MKNIMESTMTTIYKRLTIATILALGLQTHITTSASKALTKTFDKLGAVSSSFAGNILFHKYNGIPFVIALLPYVLPRIQLTKKQYYAGGALLYLFTKPGLRYVNKHNTGDFPLRGAIYCFITSSQRYTNNRDAITAIFMAAMVVDALIEFLLYKDKKRAQPMLNLPKINRFTEKAFDGISMVIVTGIALKELYPLYVRYKNLTAQRKAAQAHTAFQSMRTVLNPDALDKFTSTGILQIILQYAAAPLHTTLHVPPQTLAPHMTAQCYHLDPPFITKDGALIINISYFNRNTTTARHHRKTYTASTDRTLNIITLNPLPTEFSGYPMLVESSHEQDTLLNKDTRCVLTFDTLPTATEEGRVSITLYLDEACRQFAENIAKKGGLSVEQFLHVAQEASASEEPVTLLWKPEDNASPAGFDLTPSNSSSSLRSELSPLARSLSDMASLDDSGTLHDESKEEAKEQPGLRSQQSKK